ncbi:hypothetical protein Wildcat_163 [Mycobacterium phage Wildcat]|uniref:Uncharacterized protein n=4 Tax=Mycobacterium virus Wildcat TaxID=1993859 RepID=Q19XS1_9CAUD|nr:hypothetical protein Wildcat_163 [Mycobacterium phage Wildcat]AJD82211.1 hypothetical protein COSMO_164 [Mycobacterium phage Cosmo]AQT25805.1 hypothetical protein EniyanLRS_156 [Mycobacterium phage EniyanLRS]QGJ90021.1 hypothetical protein PBI_MARYV_149 [Mycobacterium phage MaryV]WKR36144.1 hypothetical protein [Mycobacterium phage Azrael100]ABE67743.1 hypothetical protein Wildcat_163 [Mycobacterium phage Wildcat]
MTNLQLPAMTYANLHALANGSRTWVKIAYATWVRETTEGHAVPVPAIEVRHHNTVIAIVSSRQTWVSNGGYVTRTTANRLDRILFANTGIHVGIKNGSMEFRYRDGRTLPWLNSDYAFYHK